MIEPDFIATLPPSFGTKNRVRFFDNGEFYDGFRVAAATLEDGTEVELSYTDDGCDMAVEQMRVKRQGGWTEWKLSCVPADTARKMKQLIEKVRELRRNSSSRKGDQ